MSTINTGVFWADALERAVKTIAQTVLALLASNQLEFFNIDWKSMISAGVLAGLVSILTSIVSAGVTPGNSASLVVDNVEVKK